MSGKTSMIIIGIVVAILAVGVYHFSAPDGRVHLAPMLGSDEPATTAQTVKDTISQSADSLAHIQAK